MLEACDVFNSRIKNSNTHCAALARAMSDIQHEIGSYVRDPSYLGQLRRGHPDHHHSQQQQKPNDKVPPLLGCKCTHRCGVRDDVKGVWIHL